MTRQCGEQDQGGFPQLGQSYKMTNCAEPPGIKEVISTDKSQFTNRESPQQMGKTGLPMEKLSSSGKRLAAALRRESS